MSEPSFWSSVTVASRIMLPAHALFTTLLGLGWLLQDDMRTQIPALAQLRGVWPIYATGTVLLILGLLTTVAILTGRHTLAGLMLGATSLAWLIIAGLIALTATSPDASLTASVWPLYVATAHIASIASLANDETTIAGANRRNT